MLVGWACTSHTACMWRSEGNLKLGSHLPSHLRWGPCRTWLCIPGLLAHKPLPILLFLPPAHHRSNRIVDGAASSFFYLGSRSSRSGPHTRMASSLSTELPLALKRENSNEASFESRVSSQRPKQLRLSFSKSVFCRPSAKGEQRFPDFQTNQGRTEKALGKVNAFPPN